jgi:pimeloyl-ACP methyl ester carboxylesterase
VDGHDVHPHAVSQRREQPVRADGGFVLIHGAMLGRWIWERVERRLAGPTLAVDLPGRGQKPADVTKVTLANVVDSVVADIEAWPTDRFVLVAHSLSGIVVPAVFSRFPRRIAHVVFVSAAVPERGASYLDALPLMPRISLRFVLLTQRKGPLSPAWATRRVLCNDLDDPTTQLVVDNLTREAPRIYSEPVPGEIPASMPTTYVRLGADRGFSPALQDRMIARLPNPRVEEMDAGHLPMLGHPDELAAVCNSVIARSEPD